MDEKDLKAYEELFERLSISRQVRYGSPDQYQFRQNELLHALAEFILRPYKDYRVEKLKNGKDEGSCN